MNLPDPPVKPILPKIPAGKPPRPKNKAKTSSPKRTFPVGQVIEQTAIHALTQLSQKRARSTKQPITLADDRLLRRIAGLSVDDLRSRLRDRLSGLADEIVDQLRDKVSKIRPDSLPYALEVVVNKMDQLGAKASVQNAHVHFHAAPNSTSKEDLIAALTGQKPLRQVTPDPVPVTEAQPPPPTSHPLPPSPTPHDQPSPTPSPTSPSPAPLQDTPPPPTPPPSCTPPIAASPSSHQESQPLEDSHSPPHPPTPSV